LKNLKHPLSPLGFASNKPHDLVRQKLNILGKTVNIFFADQVHHGASIQLSQHFGI